VYLPAGAQRNFVADSRLRPAPIDGYVLGVKMVTAHSFWFRAGERTRFWTLAAVSAYSRATNRDPEEI
jgi:hypothetical protein